MLVHGALAVMESSFTISVVSIRVLCVGVDATSVVSESFFIVSAKVKLSW